MVAEVIMLPKPGKSPQEISLYRPISLLPVVSKLYDKLLLKRYTHNRRKKMEGSGSNNVTETMKIIT